ncbi:MAG: hypothetical protein HOK63_00125 [Thaumarchaeota archaeon]|jgi:hypothetical protein|nr:hypothetical protein [Nitrososphaerota archaeon]MBT6468049.1 hypothetical protein [Nitrososphaerota archaeon]
MIELILPEHLKDKIYEIRYLSDDVSKIVSYFPLTISEKDEIISILNSPFDGFFSIFSDPISNEQWGKTKQQIKKRFNDELFDIDEKPSS